MSLFEVETKIKIHDLDKLRGKVRKIAYFSKKEIKKDSYFAIKRNKYPHKAFRIRNDGKGYVVNFKKWIRKYWTGNIVVKEEFEFALRGNEKSSFLSLMQDLGFAEWINKRKISESYIYKKDKRIVIEINNVANLGYFMEIEYLCNKNEIEMARRKIEKVLRELEIKHKQIDNIGYTKVLWDKKIKK